MDILITVISIIITFLLAKFTLKLIFGLWNSMNPHHREVTMSYVEYIPSPLLALILVLISSYMLSYMLKYFNDTRSLIHSMRSSYNTSPQMAQ